MNRPRPLWTTERDALLRQMVADGVPRRDCVARLAALPGPAITRAMQVGSRMHKLGLKLADEHYRATLHVASALPRGAAVRMTAERLAYLRVAFPAGVDLEEILATSNAMEGPPIKSVKAICEHAKRNGIKRPRQARPRGDETLRKAAKVAYEKRRRADKAAARAAKPPRRYVPPPVVQEPVEVVEPSPAIADAVTEARYARVKAALGKRDADAAALARVHGMPLREVYRLAGERRREMRA